MDRHPSLFAIFALTVVLFGHPQLHCRESGYSDSPVTFDWIKSAIENENITTIDKLISILPERYRKNFVLMKSSQSSQGATPERPRVIMFGEADTTILSFNGDENLRGFDKIEIMEFKNKTNKFELREIDFSTSKPQFSQPNPARCIKCHQEKERRPNWPMYPEWPDAYGANDDILNEQEFVTLKKFLQESPGLERYRHLIYDETADLGPFSIKRKGDPNIDPICV